MMRFTASSLLVGTTLAAMLAAAPAAAAQQQRPDTARAVLAPTRQQALAAELMRLRAQIEALRAELARSTADAADSRALRTTIESLEQSRKHLEDAIREHSTVVDRRQQVELRASTAAGRARTGAVEPSGWVGLTTQNTYTVSEGSGGSIRMTEPPVIVTVAPGSPAFRAGLVAGDTLVSINQRDARIVTQQLSSMLRPGDTLVFRVRRAEGLRTIPVMVEPRAVAGTYSVSIVRGGSGNVVDIDPRGTAEVASVSARPAPAAGGVMVAAQPTLIQGQAVSGTVGAGGTAPTTVYWVRQPGLAGARLEPLSRDLASKLGVESGLYVFSVAPETPMARSGLRAGDVILGTHNSSLLSLAQLSLAMQNSSAKALELKVWRDRVERTVTLRW